MDSSKVALAGSAAIGKVASVIGYILGSFAAIAVIVMITDEDLGSDAMLGFVIILAVLVPISAFCIAKGIQVKRRIRRFRKYVSLISLNHMTALENLAASTNTSVDFVRKDLAKMINKRFFTNASIDNAANEIVIGSISMGPFSPMQVQAGANPQPVETVVFKCEGCGATGSKPRGAVGVCEYCGSTAAG